jgi:hypothetical protein
MRQFFILVLFLFSPISYSVTVLDFLGGQEAIINQYVPEKEFIKRVKIEETDQSFDHQLVNVSCSNTVTPVNRDQRDKEYHFMMSVYYQNAGKKRLSGLSKMCATSQRSTSKCRGKKGAEKLECERIHLRCLKTKVFKLTVLSDTYYDECGIEFRGFGLKKYAIPGESMVSLRSRGHKLVVEHVFSGGVRSYKHGETNSVSLDEFLFFTE